MANEKAAENTMKEFIDSALNHSGVPKTESANFIWMLKQNGVINEEDKILINKFEKLENLFKAMEKRYFDIILRFQFNYNKIINSTIVEIPEHLKTYVKMHLKDFIENAELALQMEADVEYQVTIPPKTTLQETAERQIVIVDRDTGVYLPKSHWHKGLHQFLQLKHGLRLTALSTKALFISNISYYRKFGCIYGFSGTLGSELEKKQLEKLYQLKSIIVPSSNIKQFYEERTIVTSTAESHYNEIYNAIYNKLWEGRSILVIADSIKQVTEISNNIKEKAEILHDVQREPFDSIILYKYDYENYLEKIGGELDEKRIIIATNLAGRGIDLKLKEELLKKGGLHVIVAFHPRNIRIEEQAFGRAARCGECGTAQLIICDKSVKNEATANILELKWKRDIKEKSKMDKITAHYENHVQAQKECFSLFCTKYDKLRKNLQTRKEDLKNIEIEKQLLPSVINTDNNVANKNDTDNDETEVFLPLKNDESVEASKNILVFNEFLQEFDEYKKILIDDLLDNWAMFLDRCEYKCKTKESKVEDTKLFCDKLNVDGTQEPTQPLNILRCAILKIKKKKKNEYIEAKMFLTKLANEFPAYLPEAQYYSFYLDSKEKEGEKQISNAEKELEKIKNGFTKRLANHIKNSSTVKQYMIKEENRIFTCDN
uniref:Uncharacterized protein n=1 Tax=Panagrolaimus sp. PS1159 TaxID=55785 RepID=A0AC35GIJ7_9BILA